MTSTFHTTHWSVVLAAKGDDTAAKAALRELCESYRAPILRYIERVVRTDSPQRYGGRNAEDLTHDFLARILEGKMFVQLRREGAPFRVYLLGALRYFLSQLRVRESAQKRGGSGHCTASSGDCATLHPRLFVLPDDTVFDREWALAMVQRAIRTLDPTDSSVKRFLPWITQEMTAETRQQLAGELGISEGAVKISLHRLRKKFRHNIRALIAETLKDASEIDAELDYLIRALKNEK